MPSLAGGLAAAVVILRRHHAGDLPGQVLFAFAGCAIATLLISALLADDPLMRQRRLPVLMSGTSLLLATAVLLRAVTHGPLLANLARTTGRRAGSLRSLVVYAVRPSLIAMSVAVAAICFGVVSGHVLGRSAEATDRLEASLRRDLHRVATMLPPRANQLATARTTTRSVHRSSELQQRLVLLGLALVALAVLIGWTMGSEIRHTFGSINDRLGAMASAVEPTFEHPLQVSSIDEVGELTAAVGLLRLQLEKDLASYRTSLQRTRDAEQRKRQFISDIDAVLRVPLADIRARVQRLLDGSFGPLGDTQREDLQVIDAGGKQLMELLGDVLDLSIIESGSMALELRPIEADPLVGEALKGQRAAAAASDVQLVAEVADRLPPLLADRRRLRQVLDNLLGNALRFTAQGSITVRVRPCRDNEQNALIEVEDTGSGISANDLPFIFEAYRQAGTRSDRRGGSGLGLAICRRIVEQHGGSISARSEVGVGTCLAISWPLYREG